MVSEPRHNAVRYARAKRALYSSAVLSVVAGAVAVLGAPYKW